MRFTSTITRGAALACALLGLAAPGALAASGTGENQPLNLGSTGVHHAAASGGDGIVRTLIALVIVIALIYVVARVLKAVKGGGNGERATGDGLTHLATLPLAQGKSVALVRSGPDVVLVGISESGVTPIKTYTEAEAVAGGLLSPYEETAAGAPAANPQGMLETLRRMTVRT